jgi:hypothetical protein
MIHQVTTLPEHASDYATGEIFLLPDGQLWRVDRVQRGSPQRPYLRPLFVRMRDIFGNLPPSEERRFRAALPFAL